MTVDSLTPPSALIFVRLLAPSGTLLGRPLFLGCVGSVFFVLLLQKKKGKIEKLIWIKLGYTVARIIVSIKVPQYKRVNKLFINHDEFARALSLFTVGRRKMAELYLSWRKISRIHYVDEINHFPSLELPVWGYEPEGNPFRPWTRTTSRRSFEFLNTNYFAPMLARCQVQWNSCIARFRRWI